MNWGIKIFVLYTGFVLLTLSMVFFTMNQEIFLVEKDYYKQEIAYQDQMDKIGNAMALKVPLHTDFDSVTRILTIAFPPEHSQAGIEGNVLFFRPSDATLDRQFDLLPDPDGNQHFILKDYKKGRWRVKISWQSKGVPYYEERIFNIL